MTYLPKRVVNFPLTLLALLASALLSPSLQAENLIADPSFESTQQPDQFGKVFDKWQGWIYDQPARFAVGTIAHSGKTSCELIADAGGTIRIFSPAVVTPAGRYRIKAFIRGLDIGRGSYDRSIDFSAGFDGKFININKAGTFGWTPITYVFDYSGKGDLRPFIGLLGGGRLWIDDVSLEKAADSDPITPEPVLGAEESPIAPPAPLSGKALARCPVCGYLNAAASTKCYACGTELLHDIVKTGPAIKPIATFSDGTTAPFIGGAYTKGDAPGAAAGIRINKEYIQIVTPQNWSGYDYFKFDAYNPSDHAEPMYIEIQDSQTRGYWTRVNQASIIPPGKSTITFPTNLYVGEKARPGRTLITSQITKFTLGVMNGTVVASNFRLERLDTDAVKFPGLLAFSFGPMDAPLLSGFARVTTGMSYAPQRGFGWENATFWHTMNVLQPDSLTQSCVTPQSGDLRVDLPNGKYHILLNIDFPGGFWGEPQAYTHRQVTANGAVVVDETMNVDQFIQHRFQNAHREDLPGLNTFDDYVQNMFHVKEFDADVTDGILRIGFTGDTWANCLSHLIIYPTAESDRGEAFVKWVTERRRQQFNDYFKQVEPKHAVAPADAYVVFTRPITQAVNAYDGPDTGEKLDEKGLALSAATDEPATIQFAIQPPAAPMGAIDVKLSDFQNDKGDKLDPASFQPGWIDYRICRVEMDGSVYSVGPRYWHPTPAPAAAGVTRRIWIRFRAVPSTKPGIYHGTITIVPQNGEQRAIPVALTVLPFQLDPIDDVAVGPFGSRIDIGWPFADPKQDQWTHDMFGKLLAALKDGGCTSFTGRPSIGVKAANGQITLDTAAADAEMKQIRAAGFHMLITTYGCENAMGYNLYGTDSGPDTGAATAAGFANMHDFLAALYGAIDRHAQENNWVPVAWNLCDEPLGDAISAAAANAKAHREIMAGLKLTTFTGATSMEGDDAHDPHIALIQALAMPSLNAHDEHSLKIAKDAGDQIAFYNGGNRWTYGRYLKMLVVNDGLALRVSWHCNATAGDPYYALDCREDDYCWFNTDAQGTLVPSISYLSDIVTGLNDYRYLSTLQRLIKQNPDNPATAPAKRVFDEMMALTPGKDRNPDPTPAGAALRYQHDRDEVTQAILGIVQSTPNK